MKKIITIETDTKKECNIRGLVDAGRHREILIYMNQLINKAYEMGKSDVFKGITIDT